jgi:hypothetical protein
MWCWLSLKSMSHPNKLCPISFSMWLLTKKFPRLSCVRWVPVTAAWCVLWLPVEETATGCGGYWRSSRGQTTRSSPAAWGKQFFTIRISMFISVTRDLGFSGTNCGVASGHEIGYFGYEEQGLLKFRWAYLWTTLTDQNLIHEEMKSRWSVGGMMANILPTVFCLTVCYLKINIKI